VRRGRQRPVARVDERHDLVAQVGVVPPVAGESTNWLPPYDVHVSTNTTRHGRVPAPANSASAASGERRAKRRAVVPHGQGARIALNDIDGRMASLGFVAVARRHVDLDRALGRIARR
jgi:hypothetical protein